jgi:glucosamine--fructose-6-phosphate aminotransferase (isomerizing)
VGELALARIGRLGLRARAVHAFDLAEYPLDPGAAAAVVAITHRGASRHAIAALTQARAAGGVTAAIVGQGVEAPAGADHVLRTVEQEASSCHTVSYTTSVAMLVALAAAVGHDDEAAYQLDALPDLLASLLGQEAWEELAARFGGRRRYWVVGGGPNAPTAYEGALKLGEAAWTPAIGLGCEQFLHGPWAAMEPDDLVVLVAPPGPSHARCRDVARVVAEVGAALIALVAEDDRDIGGLAAETIALPPVAELLSPILAVVPLQLLAYHLAVKAGANPDTMRAEQPVYGRARATAAV